MPQYAPAPVTLTFDLLTLKVVSKSRVTWATSVIIQRQLVRRRNMAWVTTRASVLSLVFLGRSVLDLGLVYATDSQTLDNIIA